MTAKIGCGLLALLSIAVGAYGLHFLVGASPPPEVAANGAGMGWLVVHAVGAAFALLLGPWQFIRRLRTRRPGLHRALGRGYIAAALVGGVAGFGLAWNTTSGPVADWGFLLLAVCWLGATGAAFAAVRARNFARHRAWMVRSFALAFGAVTLRLQLGLVAAFDVPFATAYPWIAWLSWVPNLVVVELLLRRRAYGRWTVAQPTTSV